MVNPSLVITAVEQAFKDYHKGVLMLSGRLTSEYKGMGGSSLFLPSLHTEQRFFGLKQASVFPANLEKSLPSVMSQYLLYSADTGELVSMLNFEDLTNYKTAATAAIATKYLARTDAHTLSIFGSGALARAVLAAVIEIRPIDKVRIYNFNKKRAEKLIAWAHENHRKGIDYQIASTPSECLSETDIVCTCTTSSKPVFDGKTLPDGCHINAMGAWRPDMQEIDAISIQRAGKIYCDVIADTWQEAGDLIYPRDAGLIDSSVIHGELGALLTGELSGRETTDEITLYESVGLSVLDLAVAVSVYDLCMESGIGLTVKWWNRIHCVYNWCFVLILLFYVIDKFLLAVLEPLVSSSSHRSMHLSWLLYWKNHHQPILPSWKRPRQKHLLTHRGWVGKNVFSSFFCGTFSVK